MLHISWPVLGGTGGALVKQGAGRMTLSGMNAHTGNTTIKAGTLAISADNNLGAVGGPLTFDGGALRYNAAFDVAATRAVTPRFAICSVS